MKKKDAIASILKCLEQVGFAVLLKDKRGYSFCTTLKCVKYQLKNNFEKVEAIYYSQNIQKKTLKPLKLKLITLTEMQQKFLQHAISMKDVVLPLNPESLNREIFIEDYGFTPEEMNLEIANLKNKLRKS